MKDLVSLQYVDNYDLTALENAVNESFLRLNMNAVIKPKMKVMLKVCMPFKANSDAGEISNPNVVSAVVNVLTKMGASCLVVDSPFGKFSLNSLEGIYLNTGMLEVNSLTDCELNRDLNTVTIEYNPGVKTKSFTLLDAVNQVDVIINLSKVKLDEKFGFGGSCMNMFGLIPGEEKDIILDRMEKQKDFNNYIIDLVECLKSKIVLNIADGIVALEAKKTQRMLSCLAMSKNIYSLDACMVDILGLSPDRTILKQAQERGLIDLTHAYTTIGEDVTRFKLDDFALYDFDTETRLCSDFKNFERKIKSTQKRCLINKNTCKGCGVCAKTCPVGAIMLKYDKNGELFAEIDYKKCVFCFRCFDACPYKVVKIDTPRSYNRIKKQIEKYKKPEKNSENEKPSAKMNKK